MRRSSVVTGDSLHLDLPCAGLAHEHRLGMVLMSIDTARIPHFDVHVLALGRTAG